MPAVSGSCARLAAIRDDGLGARRVQGLDGGPECVRGALSPSALRAWRRSAHGLGARRVQGRGPDAPRRRLLGGVGVLEGLAQVGDDGLGARRVQGLRRPQNLTKQGHPRRPSPKGWKGDGDPRRSAVACVPRTTQRIGRFPLRVEGRSSRLVLFWKMLGMTLRNSLRW